MSSVQSVQMVDVLNSFKLTMKIELIVKRIIGSTGMTTHLVVHVLRPKSIQNKLTFRPKKMIEVTKLRSTKL